MRYAAIAVVALLPQAWAAPPAKVKQLQARTETGANIGVDVPTATPIGPPGATGQQRGPLSLNGYSPDNPTDQGGDTVIPSSDYKLAPGQTEDADLGLYLDMTDIENPQPIRGPPGDAPTDPGPRNLALDRQNSDIFAPPGTDAGDVLNAKWPMGLSHNRHGLKGSGWARQQSVRELPISTTMAGVDMRLEPNAYRELHWHKANEWAYIMNGSVRVQAMNEAGQVFIDDLQAGDLWFFPAGKPHSIQASEQGVEFLLVFDDGEFSEDNTFLVSELFERNPQSVLAKDLRVDTPALDNIPDGQLYIFPGTPYPSNISEQNSTGPAGSIPQSSTYSYHFSQQQPYEVPGGSVKIVDPINFPGATHFAAALFTIKPGAMRELHWHTASDEWSFFLSGSGRLTVYEAPASARTFDFQAGDVGYVPVPNAHYLENTGDEDLVYLEILQAEVYNDISVAQWLGLTPKQVVKDHLGFSDDTLSRLPKIKPYILPGNRDLTTTDFRDEQE
ncbi:oxalate decarboxylase, secreted [Polychaeton citri CBS 116435]|uniref:Oxalate decarboxylase, secreted n=1 Tax=Polychaeton citri CBS 116435 TaxID=1314669 RepID=A0A9P4QFB6_9PEZI|nr:oxalate decarboxylase, secreted [Polychaeton citri CBS 116435]